ncbi:MAG: hypothetical protein ACK5LE_05035 [Alphaproteobacteria bacterium]
MKKIIIIVALLLSGGASAWAQCNPVPASYRAYNYGALTLRKDLIGQIPHYEGWPGYVQSKNIVDTEGNSIMYFSTIESGIAAWWAWFDRKGFRYDAPITLRQIAAIYGDGIERKIRVYVDQWSGLSEAYFGHKLSIDEPINLADKGDRWALAQTMFRHESGPGCPLPFDQNTFERGLRLAHAHLQKRDPITMKSDINIQAYRYDD